MGNCIQRNQAKEMHEDQKKQQDDQSQRQTDQTNSGFVKESSLGEKGNLRVKIVVTKEELEWLMFQLNDKGGKSLEDVLEEIERGRGKVESTTWKPSLESIMECPEVVEMYR